MTPKIPNKMCHNGSQLQILTTSQVLSDVAETENLGESLFTRLVTQGVRPGPLAGGIIGWW